MNSSNRMAVGETISAVRAANRANLRPVGEQNQMPAVFVEPVPNRGVALQSHSPADTVVYDRCYTKAIRGVYSMRVMIK